MEPLVTGLTWAAVERSVAHLITGHEQSPARSLQPVMGLLVAKAGPALRPEGASHGPAAGHVPGLADQ